MTPSSKKKLLSKALVKSGFAFKDECLFHTQLHSGNLKTKLSTSKIKEVVKQLELFYSKQQRPKNQWEKSVKKQTSIFQKVQNLESSLTVQNLEAHNCRQGEDKNLNEKRLLNKIKDLNLCKGVDEESAGRASVKDAKKIRDPKKALDPCLLNKKLELLKDQNYVPDPMSEMKQYLLSNAVKKDANAVMKDANVVKKNVIDQDINLIEKDEEPIDVEIARKNEVPEMKSLNFDEDDNEYPRMKSKKSKFLIYFKKGGISIQCVCM